MDLTFILSAAIFTLLAIVVATSLLKGSTHPADPAGPGLDQSGPKQNGYVPDNKKQKKEKAEDDWCEMSGSSHDHWDVVKSVLSEEAHPQPHTEELATPVERSSSTSMSLEVDSSPEASSGKGRRSFIGLSDKELLKCAFSHPQTEGATESPAVNDKEGLNENDSLKYVPGKARSHHLEKMMSTEELEEEQRVQREQLAAIFQLLKDNKETFGDLSEGDMEEQLRLYSI
ncbi:Matrix-remodeling-associated protein 7 [Collichthys lucidus]|uniref:Matrix-remodeling-associated protein 7 n=1 Tax=Collichthys lucidus TaxID=240159 RepID=A0A4U5VMZ3_COLLU|nr:Matrix-remodeling-associated protein 7 [Collichthys lucidus]